MNNEYSINHEFKRNSLDLRILLTHRRSLSVPANRQQVGI